MASPSAAQISSALTRRSTERVPAKTTSPPSFRTPATLICGAFSGITMTARTPTRRAAHATAWPWLPLE